jgi:hypothetical protein
VFDDTIIANKHPSKKAEQWMFGTGPTYSHQFHKMVYGHQILCILLYAEDRLFCLDSYLYNNSGDMSPAQRSLMEMDLKSTSDQIAEC